MLGSYLTYFRPVEAKTLKAYQDGYTKVPGNVAVTYMRGENGNSILAARRRRSSTRASRLDPEKRGSGRRRSGGRDAASAYPAAIKIMTPEQAGVRRGGSQQDPGPSDGEGHVQGREGGRRQVQEGQRLLPRRARHAGADRAGRREVRTHQGRLHGRD